jgi:hypothetical protein
MDSIVSNRLRVERTKRSSFQTNVIVLWNTIYVDAALTQLRAEGYFVRDEDVARLSPSFMNTSICWAATPLCYRNPWSRGELRPVRGPADDEP